MARSLAFMVFGASVDDVASALPEAALRHEPDMGGVTLELRALATSCTVVPLEPTLVYDEATYRSFIEYASPQDIVRDVAAALDCAGYLACVFAEAPEMARVLAFGGLDDEDDSDGEDLEEDPARLLDPLRRLEGRLGCTLVVAEPLSLVGASGGGHRLTLPLSLPEEPVDWEARSRGAASEGDRLVAIAGALSAGVAVLGPARPASPDDEMPVTSPRQPREDDPELRERIRAIEAKAFGRLSAPKGGKETKKAKKTRRQTSRGEPPEG